MKYTIHNLIEISRPNPTSLLNHCFELSTKFLSLIHDLKITSHSQKHHLDTNTSKTIPILKYKTLNLKLGKKISPWVLLMEFQN